MTKLATFALGCFWEPDISFSQLPGVIQTAVGYTGGYKERPTYEQVCTLDTGHAETVQVEYDFEKISYKQLLEHFWSSHDPTQLNRQGPDAGKQYRSMIFYHDDKQRLEAEKTKQELMDKGVDVVTEIVPAQTFYPAEEYHQKYLLKNTNHETH